MGGLKVGEKGKPGHISTLHPPKKELEAAKRNWLSMGNWRNIHTRMLELAVRGLPRQEIAETLKVHPRTVTRVFDTDYFQRRYDLAHQAYHHKITKTIVQNISTNNVAEARRVLDENIIAAATIVSDIAKGRIRGSREQLNACKDILDRCGLKPIEIVETRERVYSPEEITSAKRVLEETQAIVERLATKESPFVTSTSGFTNRLESSDTDISSDDHAKQDVPAEANLALVSP